MCDITAPAQAFRDDGYAVLPQCLDGALCRRLGATFEGSISQFAKDNGVTRAEYLSVVNKWPHWNTVVMDAMEVLAQALRREVARTLDASVAWPVGATMFRKEAPGGTGPPGDASPVTHAHQDIAYARFPGAQMFRATTWVPLILETADALAFAKGSHRGGLCPAQDFLYTSPPGAQAAAGDAPPIPACDAPVAVDIGDCIVFDARAWHASTPMPVSATRGLRLAIGIQWLAPGGLDGAPPGRYPRWPEGDVPARADVSRLRRDRVFGIDTAGYWLKQALVRLKLGPPAGVVEEPGSAVLVFDPEAYSTLALAEEFGRAGDAAAQRALRCGGLGTEDAVLAAQRALRRYALFRRAARRHFGECQGAVVFGPVFEDVVKPVLRFW